MNLAVSELFHSHFFGELKLRDVDRLVNNRKSGI